MAEWYKAVTLAAGEELHGIAQDKRTFSHDAMSYLANARTRGGIHHLVARGRFQNYASAHNALRDYINRYLWQSQFPGTTFVVADMWKMQLVINKITTSCIDQQWGMLWEAQAEIVDYATLLNDPNYVGYIGMKTRINTTTSSIDKTGRPIILQYLYPLDHRRRPGELVTSVGSFQKSYPTITITLPMVKYMRYPLAAASLINLCNSDTFLGFTTRKCRIEDVGYKALYSPGGRTGDALYKHYYLIMCEVSMSDNSFDSTQEILDDTGRPPVDRGTWLALQEGCEYPGIDTAIVNYTIPFLSLWPQFTGLSLSTMFSAEFAGITIS